MHSVGEYMYSQSTVSVIQEVTEVEACMATYFRFVLLQIINGRLHTGSPNFGHNGGRGHFS